MSDLSFIKDNLALVVPLLVVQFALMLTALVHVLKHKSYRVGNRILWIIVVVAISIIGPIAYFLLGSDSNAKEEDNDDA